MDADDAVAHSDMLTHISCALEKYFFPVVLLLNAVREDGSLHINFSGMDDGLLAKADVVRRFFLEVGWHSMCTLTFRHSLFHRESKRSLLAEASLLKAEFFVKANTFALMDEEVYVYRSVKGSAINSPFETRDFYNRAYVGNVTLEMLPELGGTRGNWALSFNGCVATTILSSALITVVRAENAWNLIPGSGFRRLRRGSRLCR
ncbi:hypothetical protein ACTNDK_06360 [Collinsella sp. HCP3S3_B1]